MPASGGDPVSTALRLSLTSERTGDLEKRLVASSANVLLSHIEYESSGTFKSSMLDTLKGKYTVLRTGGPISNGSTCLKSCNKKLSDEMRPEPDAVLPTPERTLFPAEKVQLGWRGTFPVGAGMINMGNTCYLNSTLQALFHVPALVNWLQSDSGHLEKCSINGGIQSECIICALNKTMKASHNKGAGIIKPLLIYSKLKTICKHMNQGQQEDAHEFMRYLIESMEKAYLLRYKVYKLDNYSKETTPLNQIFGGYIRSEVTCLQCRAVSTTFQHFQDLLLDIRRASTLEDALSAYFTHERLEGDDAYRCERCHRKVPANKKFSLEKPPMVLCIQLKRFSMLGAKLNKHVEFPQRLDLTRYLCPQSQYRGGQPLTYRLTSLVLHMGSSVNCGHYTAVAQTSTGHWYQFDDSSVRPISLNSVLDMNAYIIIYEMDKSEANIPQTQPAVSTKPATVTSVTSQNTLTNGSTGYKTNLQRLVSPAMIPTSVKAASQTNGLLNNHKPAAPVTSKLSPVKSPVKVTKTEAPIAINNVSSPAPSSLKERVHSSPLPQSLVPYDPGDSTGTDSEPEGDGAARDSSSGGPGDDSSVPSPPSNSPTPPPPPVTIATSTPTPAPSPRRTLQIPRAGWQVTEQGICTKPPPPPATSAPIAAATTTWCVSSLSSAKDSTPGPPQQPQRPVSVPTQSDRHCNGSRNNNDDSPRLHRDEVRSIVGKEVANGDDRASPIHRSRIPHTVVVRMPRDERSDGDSRPSNSGKGPSQMWDGAARTEITGKLKHLSHQGYAGAQVTSWGGERSYVDIELEKERDKERKRSLENLYDEELDRGRAKKMKFNNNSSSQHNSRPKYNSFQQYHNEKIRWNNSGNMFRPQVYYRPHHSHPHPPPYHHKGLYYKNRGGHSFHKFNGSGRFGGSKQGSRWQR
ncbi:ubiquitin carboxyl-terminal hydrolase 36 isoform X1 [Schistocerca nitens]|uniref:ubiquitin carboxyl-terminal hydrolase 36 isoform X1 n=1 Tax=Schistocerca nitens TaxID=7011 RepID=UPI00211996CE|nr:ubiquitin carboxyl-terminal hydrolase 36 isoform X1 [Schistocerca nitens]XP_049810549.1 ubiquitin carboxyl-terminal hydrolase 36 isoform X1 [Schistocerca nitens]